MNDLQRYIAGFLVLKAVTIALLVLLFVFVLHGQDQSRVAACKDTRVLLSTIVLRSLGTDLETYHQDPEGALRVYRRSLEANKLYRENPELIRRAVSQTRSVMVLADPRRCR